MPKAAKLLDVGAAHGCFPPTPIISGSGDVSINNRKKDIQKIVSRA